MQWLNSDLITPERALFALFALIIVGFLVIDLGFFQRKAHKISLKSAAWQSAFWVSISLSFAILIYYFYQDDPSVTTTARAQVPAIEYLSAYLMEWSLSVDNIFVFIIILRYFNVKEEYYHKVLYYGILGAIIFRALFISIGVVLVENFHWVLYIFGVILLITGYKMLRKKPDDQFKPAESFMYRFLTRHFRFCEDDAGGKFTILKEGKRYCTPLLLVILMIETTDILFALDSIPAVFAISQDRFIIYTSNIFAVMGLRAMFFLLIGIIDKFKYLQQGISLILIFIGTKVLLEIFDIHIPTFVSFVVILVMLSGAIVLSAARGRKDRIHIKKNGDIEL